MPVGREGGTARDGRRPADRVTVFIAALTVAAIAAVAAAIATIHAPARAGVPTIMALGGLLVAAEIMIVRIQFRGDVMALSLGEALLAPAIFLSGAVEVALLAAAAQVLSGAYHRIGARKTVFNVAQWCLAAMAGAATFHALRDGTSLSIANVAALVIAMSVIATVNAIAFLEVIALVQRKRTRDVVAPLLPAFLAGWVLNTAFGIMFVATGVATPAALAVFAVPLAVLFWASRQQAAAAADRARLQGMHRAMLELTTPIDPEAAIPRFLSVVRECFASDGAELLIVRDRAQRHVLRGDVPEACERHEGRGSGIAAALLRRGDVTCVDDGHRDPVLEALLRHEGWRDCLAAPLVTADGVIGVLAVYDRSGHEGFEEGELAVLQALASETAGALQKGALLESLLSERRKLAEVVESTADGILMIDGAGTILMWNPALEAITGYLASEMVGSRMLSALLPRDAEGTVVRFDRFDAEAGLPSEIEIVCRTGEPRWLSCSYARMAPSDERPASLIVIARDVTKSRELERLKEDFVATVSHELRTPLTPIKGWASTLIDVGERLTPQDRAAAARSILQQAEGLERLIVNLLEVSKIERGVVDLSDAVVDVKDTVARVILDARHHHPGRDIAIQASGACRARGDDVWVERIVSNLLSNALKYSPDNTPVEVSVVEKHGEISVSVRDHGAGIPAHDQDRIFERFQRLGNHLTRATGGTGLGLYIARQLARALGGDVTVDSTVGAGSTFTLSLEGASRLVAVG